jgi:conjugative relaxase-like TrwC/TraI family protein
MTCHVLHAGDGYTYLTRQVATHDVPRTGTDPLVDYYQLEGNHPGQWAGTARADLDVNGVVTEEQMLALFGEGLRPDANEFISGLMARGVGFEKALGAARLGRKYYTFTAVVPLVGRVQERYREFEETHQRRPSVVERRDIKETTARALMVEAAPDAPPPSDAAVRRFITDQLGKAKQPVAGYDLVFSPVKSVSVLWALGGHEVRRAVEEVHERAWQAALAYGEREAAFTRTGPGGISQVATSGFVAAAFQHRDSRAGDPDLHTHVAVANRVLAADGTWRTVDGQQLFRVAVSMSETYNSLIEQGLTQRLGVSFTDVPRPDGKRAVREIDGIPTEWNTGFSRRRAQVETQYEQLVRDYVTAHGHTPSRSVQLQLAQQATLQTRAGKNELRTLAEQVSEWTDHAHRLLPDVDIDTVIDACLHTTTAPTGTGPDPHLVAGAVVERIAEERSTWTVFHVRAEAQRQLRPYRFTGVWERMTAVESTTRLALGRLSVLLDVELDPPPELLRRPDGESVFHRHGAERYTSEAVLAAEQRLLDATRVIEGPVVSAPMLESAIAGFEAREGKRLNPGQRELVAHFVSCGTALAVAIGPPGAGKSTAMRAVREAWETTGGRVIGLAPSAAAASVLGDELGVRADTLHSLTTALANGADVDVQPGDLILVDEAGMAGTATLDRVQQLALERSAVVRLVGDYRQLTAVEAGGALRLLHRDAGGVELTEVHRFRSPDEAKAVLRFRVGDERALDFYVAHQRLRGGPRAVVLDRMFADWRADIERGKTAIMISDSADIVRELSARAQTERRAAGLAEHHGVDLHDGSVAGVGDLVVTRKNRRKLEVLGGRDYVKNGDLWEITARSTDGALRVRHIRHHGEVTLPAWYVRSRVELGYAATIHRSQGLTVEIARSYLTERAVREAALVALSRGTDSNLAYLDTEQLLDPDEPATLPGDLYYRYREHTPAALALRTILRREGAELPATETLRHALDTPHRLDVLVAHYDHARHVLRGPQAAADAERWVRAAAPEYAEDVIGDEAWPELVRVIHDAIDQGHTPEDLLREVIDARPLRNDRVDPARSVAKVLHYRITNITTTTATAHAASGARPAGLPGWIHTPPPPRPATTDPDAYDDLAAWIGELAHRITDRVTVLGDRAAQQQPAWTRHLGPLPEDPARRDQWVRAAGNIAAYRERFQIPDDNPELLPTGPGERHRAQQWVTRHLACTTPAIHRQITSHSLVERTERIRARLARTTTSPPERVFDTAASPSDRRTHEPEPDHELDIDHGPEPGP